MNNLDELLAELRRRPGLYIRRATIDRLSAFISGWKLARQRREETDRMVRFQEWVANKYHVSTTHHWEAIIPFYCEFDEDPYVRFFELFDEFSESER